MNNLKHIGQIVLAFLIVCTFAGLVALAVSTMGAFDVYRAQLDAQRAEAEAERLQAQLDLVQAKSQLETARGERAILEAAARSVDADRRVASWGAVRGDVFTLAAAALGLVLGRWWNRQREVGQ